MVIGRPAVEHGRILAFDLADQAAVEAGAEFVRAPARSGIVEAGQANCADGVVVADDGGGAFEFLGRDANLTAVQELAVGEMDVGEADTPDVHQLREARGYAAR